MSEEKIDIFNKYRQWRPWTEVSWILLLGSRGSTMATNLYFFFKSKEKIEFSVCSKLYVSLGPTKIYKVKP